MKPIQSDDGAPPVRRRNAANTRQAILASARVAFARAGYDGAGVREIASGAGVTAMLVNRYFGSKENLFAEAIAQTMATTAVVLPEILKSKSGEAIATALVSITQAGDTPLEGFQIMLRSAGSARAAEIAREQIQQHQQAAIARALGGEQAAQRAALMLAMIAGLQVMRQMIGLPALADAKPKALVKVLGPVFQLLIDGPPAAGKAR
jgi:AcrR family transcriptional regulator